MTFAMVAILRSAASSSAILYNLPI
jgi:hypothetical protein